MLEIIVFDTLFEDQECVHILIDLNYKLLNLLII